MVAPFLNFTQPMAESSTSKSLGSQIPHSLEFMAVSASLRYTEPVTLSTS